MAELIQHPWDKWFSQNTITLVRKEDYDGLDHAMGIQIRRAAFKRGIKVNLNMGDGRIIVTVKSRPERKTKKVKK